MVNISITFLYDLFFYITAEKNVLFWTHTQLNIAFDKKRSLKKPTDHGWYNNGKKIYFSVM